jgi:pimeloyl-ACP methyl ester carboxylesterase
MSMTTRIMTPSPARRRARRWLIAVLVLTGLWLVGSLVVARLLTRRKGPRFDEPVPRVAWANFEGVRLQTRDGHDLGAWYAEGSVDGPSVVLLHGNGGHRGHNLSRAELLVGAGCTVLPVTLRAHGDSSGDANDIGYSARLDVVAAVEYLERRRPGRPILVLGSSMGAAAATFASADLGRRVGGYFLEAPYLDLKSAVRNRTSDYLPVGLEWVAYQGLVLVSPLVVPDLDRTSPLLAIGGVPDEVPVMLIAGRHDRKATPEQVGRLLDRVRSHGRLVIFERAGHLGYLQSDLGLYRNCLLDFVRETTRDHALSR